MKVLWLQWVGMDWISLAQDRNHDRYDVFVVVVVVVVVVVASHSAVLLIS